MKNELVSRLNSSQISIAFSLLTKLDRRKLLLLAVFNLFAGLLDLIAISLVGLLGSLAVKGITSPANSSLDLGRLDWIPISRFEFQTQVAILALVTCLLLVTRTVLSMILNRRILFFLSNRGAYISSQLIARLLNSSKRQVSTRSSQENLYAVTSGTQKLMVGFLGVYINTFADVALLFFLFLGLLFVDTIIAMSTLVLFGTFALALFLFFSRRASQIGRASARMAVEGNKQILEVIGAFREIFVRNQQHYYSDLIAKQRFTMANVEAEMAFLPLVSKYLMEIVLIVGAVIVSSIQFYFRDASQAVASLATFLVAGSRMAPAVLRIQQGLLSLKISASAAALTIAMLKELPQLDVVKSSQQGFPNSDWSDFTPEVSVSNLRHKFSDSKEFSLEVSSLSIKPGQMIALVGPSGSGKSTLVDLILGILTPDQGDVLISGLPPKQAIQKWSGAIGYVPQDILILDGSISENVCMGFQESEVPLDSVEWSLNKAALKNWIQTLPHGAQTQVGELGNRISGGQRQRLGIARALVTRPKLLVLDEATSALDGVSEHEFVNTLKDLAGQVTIIVVAHRLSSIRQADLLVYMDKGRIVAIGTFAEIRREVPDFETQAQVMGLQ